MNKFNLHETLQKAAFYEDNRGYMNSQTRAWQMCYKSKCDSGMNPQEAWESCLDSYQTKNNEEEWLLQNFDKKK